MTRRAPNDRRANRRGRPDEPGDLSPSGAKRRVTVLLARPGLPPEEVTLIHWPIPQAKRHQNTPTGSGGTKAKIQLWTGNIVSVPTNDLSEIEGAP